MPDQLLIALMAAYPGGNSDLSARMIADTIAAAQVQ
jgi:hypothetical protein